MKCDTKLRFRPDTDGSGFAECKNDARVSVTFTEFKSKMMRGPFHLCAWCAEVFEERLHVDGVEMDVLPVQPDTYGRKDRFGL